MDVVGGIKFLFAVKEDKVDFGEIISVKLCRIMVTLRLWFPKEDYEKASWLDKIISNAMFIFEVVAFNGFLAHLLLHPREDSIDIMMQKLAQILMIYVGLFMLGMSRWYRDEFSEVIAFVNTCSLRVLHRRDYQQHRPLRNRIYLAMLFILVVTALADTSSLLGFFVKTLKSGELYFGSIFFVGVTSNSVAMYLLAVLEVLVFCYVYAFCTMFIVIVIEPFLQLGMCYRVIATDIRRLRSGPEIDEKSELRKLRFLLGQCNEIHRFVEKANAMNSTFFLVYILSMFCIISLFLAVSFTMDSALEIAMFLFYPLNLYCVAGICCALGQNVVDSAQEMEVAIYDCDWHSAPAPFRKLLLMFMIRCKMPTTVAAKPFYVLNFALLTKMTNNVYMMVAVATKLLKK